MEEELHITPYKHKSILAAFIPLRMLFSKKYHLYQKLYSGIIALLTLVLYFSLQSVTHINIFSSLLIASLLTVIIVSVARGLQASHKSFQAYTVEQSGIKSKYLISITQKNGGVLIDDFAATNPGKGLGSKFLCKQILEEQIKKGQFVKFHSTDEREKTYERWLEDIQNNNSHYLNAYADNYVIELVNKEKPYDGTTFQLLKAKYWVLHKKSMQM